MLSYVIFSKSWVYDLNPKFLCYILDIQGSDSVNFMTIGCVWTARLYFTNGAYATGIEQ